MNIASFDLGKRAIRGGGLASPVFPPADHAAIGFQSTGMLIARANLGKRAGLGNRLGNIAILPADHAAIGFQAANVSTPDADLDEGAGQVGCIRVVTPAVHIAIALDGAGIAIAGAERFRLPGSAQGCLSRECSQRQVRAGHPGACCQQTEQETQCQNHEKQHCLHDVLLRYAVINYKRKSACGKKLQMEALTFQRPSHVIVLRMIILLAFMRGR